MQSDTSSKAHKIQCQHSIKINIFLLFFKYLSTFDFFVYALTLAYQCLTRIEV